jgi:hypothetical protein
MGAGKTRRAGYEKKSKIQQFHPCKLLKTAGRIFAKFIYSHDRSDA